MKPKNLILLFRTIFVLALLTCAYAVTAQEDNKPVSNIKEQPAARTFKVADTAAIMKILRRGEALKKLSPDSCLKLLTQAYNSSQRIGYYDGIAGSLIEMGRVANSMGNQQQALGLYSKAIFYGRKAYFYKHFPAAGYSNMGSIHMFMSNYELAAKYLDSSLNEGLRAGLPGERHHLVITYNNLSTVYSKMNEPALALKYVEQAEAMCRKNNFHKELRMTLNSKGNVYNTMNDTAAARRCFEDVIRLSRAADDQELIQAADIGMGVLLLKREQPRLAIAYLEDAMRNNRNQDMYYGNIIPAYNLGIAYYQLKSYDKAERYLVQALDLSGHTGFFNDRLVAHETLGRIYEETGRYQKALEQFRIYEQQKDTLLNKDKFREISELEKKYSTAQKDRQMAIKDRDMLLATAQNRRKEFVIWIISAIVVLLGAGLLVLRYLQRARIRRLSQQRELDVLKASLAGEEMERERVGQELHDGVGGYLSAIKINLATLRIHKQILQQDPLYTHTLALADEANDELRHIAHNLVPSSLVRNGLSAAIVEFCNRCRSSGTINIDVQITGEPVLLAPAAALVIYRIVQELVHNILKHARAAHATVSISWQQDMLLIAIEDDGNGNMPAATAGIGLGNMQLRVEAFKGNMSIERFAGKGTSVYLEFNLSEIT